MNEPDKSNRSLTPHEAESIQMMLKKTAAVELQIDREALASALPQWVLAFHQGRKTPGQGHNTVFLVEEALSSIFPSGASFEDIVGAPMLNQAGTALDGVKVCEKDVFDFPRHPGDAMRIGGALLKAHDQTVNDDEDESSTDHSIIVLSPRIAAECFVQCGRFCDEHYDASATVSLYFARTPDDMVELLKVVNQRCNFGWFQSIDVDLTSLAQDPAADGMDNLKAFLQEFGPVIPASLRRAP